MEASKKALGSALGMEYVGHEDSPLGQGHPPEGKAAARALEEIWASLSPAARGLLAAGAYLSTPYSIDDVADLLRCDVAEAFARHAELVRVRESVMVKHPAAPPLFEVEAAGWSYLVGRHYVELVPQLVKKTISPVAIVERSREGFGAEGAPTSRHQNIFYYYRGPSKADESADAQHRQIENNTTKALVNVLEYGSADLTASFLACFVPDAPRQVRPTRRYYLQRGPEPTDDPCWLLGVSVLGDIDRHGEIKARSGGSLIDAAIHLPGDALVAIEVKVVEYLDYEQLRRHATEWGVAHLPADSSQWPDNPAWRLARWSDVHGWSCEQLARTSDERSRFLLGQFIDYLEIIGLSPFAGFRGEHFTFFAQPANERTPAIQQEIKAHIRGLWEAIRERLDSSAARSLGEIHVNQLPLGASTATSQTNWGEAGANLTLQLVSDELQLNVVGWKEPKARLIENWLAPTGRVANFAGDLELVVFRRRPNNYRSRGTGKSPWYVQETVEEAARLPLSSLAGLDLGDLLETWRWDPDPAWEKLAYHVRCSWSRHEVLARKAELLPDVSYALTQLIPIRDAVNGLSPSP